MILLFGGAAIHATPLAVTLGGIVTPVDATSAGVGVAAGMDLFMGSLSPGEDSSRGGYRVSDPGQRSPFAPVDVTAMIFSAGSAASSKDWNFNAEPDLASVLVRLGGGSTPLDFSSVTIDQIGLELDALGVSMIGGRIRPD